MADYIPFDLQTEILKRLPVKTLLRFRSVSKPYKSLIDSSGFITDYSFNHTHQQHLFVRYYDDKHSARKYVSFVDDDTFPQQKFSLPEPEFLPGFISSTLFSVFQGLFCFKQIAVVGTPQAQRRSVNILLWNPSIRKSISVVVPDVPEEEQGSDVTLGFGGCPHTRDPKIVKVNTNEGRAPWKVEVYTLSSGAWRSIPIITQPRSMSVRLSGMHVATNEFIYWLATDEYIPYYKWTYMIWSFDLVREKFMEVSLPDSLVSAAGRMGLFKLKNSLVVFEVHRKAGKQCYDVWKMEHGTVPNTFTKLYTINSPDALSRYVAFGFRKNNEPIICIQSPVEPIEDGDMVTKLITEDIDYVMIDGPAYDFNLRSYMETLLLLDH